MSEGRPQSSLRKEIVRLGKGSATYLVATIVTRGLTLLLTPIFTRVMTPADYGIVGVGTSILPVLALVLGLSAHSAPSRLYYTLPDEESRKRLSGTVLGFLLTFPVLVGIGLEVLGSAGLFHPFRSVPYSPYLRLVLWSSVLILLPNVTLNMLVIREQHRRAAMMNAGIALATTGLTLALVVGLRRGAVGQLTAVLLTNVLAAAFSIKMMWGFGRPRLDGKMMMQVLAFSLPLVPHELSKWLLAASDRIILERSVSTADLGRYALGYTFGATVGMFVSAIGNAFFPIVNRKLAEQDASKDVPFLGTIVVVASAFAALEAASVLPPLIRLITPANFHAAGLVVPFVAVGFFFQALYTVWSQGTFYSKKTAAVALVTAVGAAVNIGLNLLLVPRFGIIAAAVNTAVGYGVMAVLHAALSQRLYPIAWEFGRTARVALAAVLAYAAAALLSRVDPLPQLFIRLAVTGVLFPALLVVFRVISRSEIRRVRELLSRRKAKT